MGDDIGGASNQTEEAEELTTAYLRSIWSYTQNHIQRYVGRPWKEVYSTKVVVGVPAIWKQSTKKKVSSLAAEAGLPEDIFIVSEPEAAALAVFRDREDFKDSFKVRV
ncbi:Chaperone protein DnaK, partial [Madurella mycetomatis]